MSKERIIMTKRTGRNNGRWKGGIILKGGYRLIGTPSHPRAKGPGSYVQEHILVAEKIFGKYLPLTAIVHHADGETLNNKPFNLVICENDSYHMYLHERMRAKERCGNVLYRRCSFCKVSDHLSNLKPNSGGSHYHQSCRAKYLKEWEARQ
jgi:hypothetical protein